MSDSIQIEVLPDGTIKTTTDAVSMPNHSNAEAFLREIARLAGGVTERKARHGHVHSHAHTHTHEHGEHTH